MTDGGASSSTGLAGRRVSLLPRAGGRAWSGTVQTWEVAADHVVARVDTSPDAVSTLDHHQVWLSTTNHTPDGEGITIFAGRAVAVAPRALELDGVVRLADEPRRQAVRAAGCRATLPPRPHRRTAHGRGGRPVPRRRAGAGRLGRGGPTTTRSTSASFTCRANRP